MGLSKLTSSTTWKCWLLEGRRITQARGDFGDVAHRSNKSSWTGEQRTEALASLRHFIVRPVIKRGGVSDWPSLMPPVKLAINYRSSCCWCKLATSGPQPLHLSRVHQLVSRWTQTHIFSHIWKISPGTRYHHIFGTKLQRVIPTVAWQAQIVPEVARLSMSFIRYLTQDINKAKLLKEQ